MSDKSNIVNDAFKTMPRSAYLAWLDQVWEQLSDVEKSVAENIEYGIKEGWL